MNTITPVCPPTFHLALTPGAVTFHDDHLVLRLADEHGRRVGNAVVASADVWALTRQMEAAAGVRIEELNLSVRAYNCLISRGIHTIAALTAKTEVELLDIRNLGHGTLNNIVAALDYVGLKLAGGGS